MEGLILINMANIRLITSNDVIEVTPMGGNVDTDRYISLIDLVQIKYLEPILGTKLYDKIIDDFDNDVLTGLYLQMVEDYVQPMLKYMTAAEYFSFGDYRVQNAGIYRNIPDNTAEVEESQVNKMARAQRVNADIFIERLERFLCDQKSDLPEYSYTQDNDYDLKPREDNSYVGGWFFGSNTQCNCNLDGCNKCW